MTVYRGEEDGFERARCHSCGVNFGDVFEVQDLLEGLEKGTSYRAWVGQGAGAESGTVTDTTAIGRALNERLSKSRMAAAGAAAEMNGSGNGNGNGNGNGAAPEITAPPKRTMTQEEMEAGFRARPGFERLYLYRDAMGEPVLAVARCVVEEGGKRKKAFPTATRIPAEQEGGGRWVLGDLPGGGKRPLYRLPELIATKGVGPVWVVEGEKAADAGASVGLTITTPSCGAEKADKTDWSPLRGRAVYILPDNDAVGRKHAQQVMVELRAVGARARIVELPGLPPKGDLADWIEDRDSVESEEIVDQLLRLKRRVPEMTVRDIRALQNPSWLINGVIPSSGVGMIFGAPASGKSFVVLDMACTASLGWKWHGRSAKPGRWIYICGEGGMDHFKLRLEAWCQSNGTDPDFRVIPQPWMFDQEQAEILVDDYRESPPKVLVVDTLARCFVGDENATSDMNSFIGAVDYVKRELGCVVLLVHHSGRKDQHRARGNSALDGAVDFSILVEPIGKETVMLLRSVKSKGVGSFEEIGVERKEVSVLDAEGLEQLDDDGKPITSCVIVPASKERLREAKTQAFGATVEMKKAGRRDGVRERRAAITLALGKGPLNFEQIQKAVQSSAHPTRAALRLMMDEGLVSETKLGTSRVYRLEEGRHE